MLRTAFGLAAGLFAAMIVITFGELAIARLFPIPAGLDPRKASDLLVIVAGMPTAARAMIVAGWCLGAFSGAAVAARLATHRVSAALSIGGFVALGTWMNAQSVPHSLWMTATGVFAPLPLAWLATRLVRPWRAPAAAPARDVWQGYDR